MGKCQWCPVAEGVPCRGEVIRHKCGSARYRAYFLRRAGAGRVNLPPDRGPQPTMAELFLNASACPHRELFKPEEREGCGCAHRCHAGRSPRANGGVNVLDCWACDIAPRLNP